ncbi:longiborneol synthase [Colletotrichum lupini]|uniref:Longiborneol synthase n=1 Tax=Colletotrichum lupini TaxID=145971 RepID=A0A9Q8WPP7_9PEZI|nr:longiborneol synthase [Colletotrichum lupini]UQC91418.1 longiborneol synthase [Colletotrichum lupini]
MSCTKAGARAMWRQLSSPLNRVFQKHVRQEDDLADQPKRLAALVAPICSQMLEQLNYPGAPQLEGEAVEVLLAYMYNRAVKIGVPLDTHISAKGFRLGYAEGLLAHPRHPVEVQGYVGLFTWLVVQYDDIVGQNNQMVEEALLFHERLFRGEPQPNYLLEGIAGLLREARDHFDTVLANMLQISVLKFLTSNLLERHSGFQHMSVTPAGQKFPDFYRDMSGMDQAYAVFYKEELSGDTRNYVHNRATCTGKPVMTVVAESWNDSVRGYMAMHTTNPRYKLTDLGIGEEHPLAPFEHRIGQLFEQMSRKAGFGQSIRDNKFYKARGKSCLSFESTSFSTVWRLQLCEMLRHGIDILSRVDLAASPGAPPELPRRLTLP